MACIRSISERPTPLPSSLRQRLDRCDLDAVKTGHKGGETYSHTFELSHDSR